MINSVVNNNPRFLIHIMRKSPSRIGRRVGSIVLKLSLGFVAGSALLVLALRWLPVPISGVMIEKSVASWADDGYHLHHAWVPAEQISPHIKLAVIASEDQRFRHHFGFDFGSLAAALEDYRDGARLRGASTISQQTAKNVFLWTGRSMIRKGLEAYFTALIELVWPKQRILEVYLNVAEFGRGVFGVEAAAQTYFGKTAANLTSAEAALLAAVLPNPLQLRVDRPSSYVLARRDWILRQMHLLGGRDYLRQMG